MVHPTRGKPPKKPTKAAEAKPPARVGKKFNLHPAQLLTLPQGGYKITGNTERMKLVHGTKPESIIADHYVFLNEEHTFYAPTISDIKKFQGNKIVDAILIINKDKGDDAVPGYLSMEDAAAIAELMNIQLAGQGKCLVLPSEATLSVLQRGDRTERDASTQQFDKEQRRFARLYGDAPMFTRTKYTPNINEEDTPPPKTFKLDKKANYASRSRGAWLMRESTETHVRSSGSEGQSTVIFEVVAVKKKKA